MAPEASESPSTDYPVDSRTCKLLGPTALVVQALMGLAVVGTLLYKRQRENPRRKWKVWVFDVSKQIVGQIVVHFSNIGISSLLSNLNVRNPCVLYFLNILVDTTIGVAILYGLLWASNKLFIDYLQLQGFQSGKYGDGQKPSIVYWGKQTTVYVSCLLGMKLVVIGIFWAWPGIIDFGTWLLSWTGGSDWAQVVVVMGLCPIILNMLQFWLIDSIVKASNSFNLLPHSPPADESHEPLFAHDSEDDSEAPSSVPRRRSTSRDLERGARAHVATQKRRLSPVSSESKRASKEHKRSKSAGTNVERQEGDHSKPGPIAFKAHSVKSPPQSPKYGATSESPRDAVWGDFDDDDWDGTSGGGPWTRSSPPRQRSPETSRRSLSDRRSHPGRTASYGMDVLHSPTNS